MIDSPPSPPSIIPDPDLAERHRRFVIHERRLTWILRGLMAILIVLFLGFMFAGWRSLRRQFAPEAFVAPGMEELGRVGRSVQQHLIAAADAATPRLLALVSERWEAFLPRLARVLQQEMEQLRSNLVTVMEDDLARMVTEVVDGKQDRLKRELPQFKDEARREIFRQQLENRLHDTSVAVTQTAYAANQEAIENLLINIGDFEADNPFGRLSDEQLNRRYLSLWLRLVDHHVLNEPIESGVSP